MRVRLRVNYQHLAKGIEGVRAAVCIGHIDGVPRHWVEFGPGDSFPVPDHLCETLEPRTEPHAPNDPGMSAADILEKVAERLDRRCPCEASTDTLRIVSRELLSLARELRGG